MICLNLGCGINRKRFDGNPFPLGTLHIDHNPEVGADIVAELEEGIPDSYSKDGSEISLVNSVDQIHAYHLIEHIGTMGDTVVWFRFWRSIWKALKPGGIVYIVCPYFLHESAVGDPTHSRLIAPQTFHFLNRDSYKVEKDVRGSAMSKLSIDFDLPLLELKLIRSEAMDQFPSTIACAMSARKTQDGALVGSEERILEAV